jgi:transcriptional regulator with XRE-family HTH domain
MGEKKAHPVAVIVGNNTRRMRESRGWTQEQLAEFSDYSNIGMIEVPPPGRVPRGDTVLKIANALGAPLHEMYRDGDEPMPAALADFLRLQGEAHKVQPHEIAALRRVTLPSNPTIASWILVLQAMRLSEGDK